MVAEDDVIATTQSEKQRMNETESASRRLLCVN